MDLRRACEAADALVAAARELRAALDSLSESVRGAISEGASDAPAERLSATAAEAEVPEGARLVALDMVLDGRPRDEVAERLRDEFGLADAEALLDDVYGRVSG